MDATDPFVTIVERGDPDDTLIPTDADPYTVVEYKGYIAEALGFPPRRYSDSLSRPIMDRLYIIICRSLPDSTHTLDELKYEVGTELEMPEADRFLGKPGRSYDRSELVTLFERLQTITYDDIRELLDVLDICPVCDTPVESRSHLGDAGIMEPTDESVCVHIDNGGITLVEHMDV